MTAHLEKPLKKHDPRLEFVRGRMHETRAGMSVEPILLRGSAMLSGMAQADCLIQFPAEKERLETAEEVQVLMLP